MPPPDGRILHRVRTRKGYQGDRAYMEAGTATVSIRSATIGSIDSTGVGIAGVPIGAVRTEPPCTGEMSVGIARSSANAAEICGDMAGWWSRDSVEILAIADGLGHGKDAAKAAAAAMDTVAAWSGHDHSDLFRRMNTALQTTRGAAVGVATVAWQAGQITYAAIGNTRAALFGAGVTRLDGDAGIVGGGYRRLNIVVVPFQPGEVLTLWTDGLEELLKPTAADHAAAGLDAMAARLLDRFPKGRDDRCVVVARLAPG
jgi:negative regulator of sigma-B (phosphoserine phosphatase)